MSVARLRLVVACVRASIHPASASLHIELHAVELGHIEVDELVGDVTVVCPKRLACRHVGDNLALDKALLVALGSLGLDGDGVILKARKHRGELARGFGDAVAVLYAGLRRANGARGHNDAGDGKNHCAHNDAAAHLAR